MLLPLQEHVLAYVLHVFFDMYAYLYLFTAYMKFASYWRNEKEIYALQKMISLLLLVHGTFRAHTKTV